MAHKGEFEGRLTREANQFANRSAHSEHIVMRPSPLLDDGEALFGSRLVVFVISDKVEGQKIVDVGLFIAQFREDVSQPGQWLDAACASWARFEAVLRHYHEKTRGEVGGLLGLTPRHARRIVSDLLKREVLVSKGPRDPLMPAFPAALASRWMPGLFPDRPSEKKA